MWPPKQRRRQDFFWQWAAAGPWQSQQPSAIDGGFGEGSGGIVPGKNLNFEAQKA